MGYACGLFERDCECTLFFEKRSGMDVLPAYAQWAATGKMTSSEAATTLKVAEDALTATEIEQLIDYVLVDGDRNVEFVVAYVKGLTQKQVTKLLRPLPKDKKLEMLDLRVKVQNRFEKQSNKGNN